MSGLENTNIRGWRKLVTPKELKQQLPISRDAYETVSAARDRIRGILSGWDNRKLVFAGPCSVHAPEAAYEYAQRIAEMRRKYGDRFEILMRVYFEKPRTTLAWKGLINDPFLNGSFDINTGYRLARQWMRAINELGVPVATEFLEPLTPQYLDNLVAWAAIGARTTESQTHRQMAAGLSMPVGFKNTPDGSPQSAVNAMHMASSPQSFLGVDEHNQHRIIDAAGNDATCLVLRGGKEGTNFEPAQTHAAHERLKESGVNEAIIVDCSHDNSGKDHTRQAGVWDSVVRQWESGNSVVLGAMLESYWNEGKQKLPTPSDVPMDQRVVDIVDPYTSVTDSCIGMTETQDLLADAYSRLS